MKKGIYITSYDLSNQSDGVVKKIKSQISCFQKAGYDMDVFDGKYFTKGLTNRVVKIVSRLFSTPYVSNRLHRLVAEMDNLSEYDFIYIRKGYSSMQQIRAYKKIKRRSPNTKLILEIPTYPYDNEFGGRRKIIAIPSDKIARKRFGGLLDRIVTYSEDELIFSVPTIRIRNGIDYSNIKERCVEKHEGINLIAVAFFDIWHGYDRLLAGMADDIDYVKKYKLRLHFVGDGQAIDSYRKYVDNRGLHDYVFFHGRLYSDDLDAIYNIADIGVDTLARHRVGVYYNSTLKGKEYCAKGLPIISGVKTDLDDLELPFYKRIPADDSNVSVKEVVEFYYSVYSLQSETEVAHEIRIKTQDYFEMSNCFRPVVNYIQITNTST